VRVLLDECTPRKLRRELPEHEVRTVSEMGWSGTKNGALLRRASAEFDVLLTVDSNMEYQQNMTEVPIAIVVLVARSNDVNVLRALMPEVRQLLLSMQPGRLYRIGPVDT
jgi:predicted nuclease of predicted toxin-antitoxin system